MRPRLPRLPRLSVVLPPQHATSKTIPPAAISSDINTSRPVRGYSVAAATALPTQPTTTSATRAGGARVPTSANFPGTTRKSPLPDRRVARAARAASSTAPRAAGEATADTEEVAALFEEDYAPAAGRQNVHEEPLAGPSRMVNMASPPPTTQPYPSASTSPPLPRCLLLPDGDSLCEQSLPYTEAELYSFLHTVKATEYRFGPDKLSALHSVPYFARLVSTRTYRFLIQYAFEASNLALVQSLLAEMQERGIKKDEHTLRVLLRGYLRHGKDEDAREVVRIMQQKGVVLVSTKPRVMVQGGKGKEKEREDFEVLWKAYEVRGREVRLREEAAQRVQNRDEPRESKAPRTKRGRRRGATTILSGAVAPASPFTAPPRTVNVPRDPATLSSSDISTIVTVLAEEGRGSTAFRVAELWLQANRPSRGSSASAPRPHPYPAPASPFFSSSFRPMTARRPLDYHSFGERVAQYHSTALVLLNILLRTLFSERASACAIRSYVLSFLKRHSAPSPARPLTPNLATLRTLVSGLKGVPDAWQNALDMVTWFGYLWGMPLTGEPHSKRIYFRVSRAAKIRAFLHLGIDRAALAAGPPGGPPLPALAKEKRQPHAVVPPDLALLLLNHATDSFLSRTLVSASRVAEVRKWWSKDLERDAKRNELWTSAKMKEAWARAATSGLMVSRTHWGKEKLREVRKPVVRPGQARGVGRLRNPAGRWTKEEKAPH
ncbi:hypothetical protein JCM11251_003708 [Rhodosporidiobolus azoricus]